MNNQLVALVVAYYCWHNTPKTGILLYQACFGKWASQLILCFGMCQPMCHHRCCNTEFCDWWGVRPMPPLDMRFTFTSSHILWTKQSKPNFTLLKRTPIDHYIQTVLYPYWFTLVDMLLLSWPFECYC